MKKIVPIFLFICLQIIGLKAQSAPSVLLKVIITETADKVKADLIIFSNDSIVGFQLSMLWDSTVVKTPVTSSNLSGLSSSNFNLKSDYLAVFWTDGKVNSNYLNGQVLFTATFDKKGTLGNPKIRIAGNPVPIEFVGSNFNILKYKVLGDFDNPYPISGKIFTDLNQDCKINTGDMPFGNQVVRAYNPNEGNYYTYSDASGNYTLYVMKPNLPYTVSVLPKDSTLWTSCVKSNNVTPQIDSTKQFDFLLKPLKICTESVVKLSIPFLRRCFSNTYNVSYQNTGTLPLQNAYIVLTLDKDLIIESATLPYTSLGNQQYKIEVGDVLIGGSGTFNFTAKLNCTTTVLGQTHCVEAQLFPDNTCQNEQGKFQISPTCTNGKVNFEVKNKNLIAATDISYFIIEDDMIFKQGNIPSFSPSQIYNIDVPANGSVWRMEIWKNNKLVATNFYEACGTNVQGKFSTGFSMQYPQNVGQANTVKSCQQSIGAYDPNDKQGFPLGTGKKHFIDQNTTIDYLIRFQNTGTDTAFNVIVEDRIDDLLLDLSKIRILSSSHKMTWSIKNKNTLVFDFKNIMLPDSFKSSILSNGFIRFSIDQKRDNALQSVVKNKANIYFDFNDAVITNETFHTIGKDFLSTSQNIFVPYVSVVLKPNPFTSEANMEIIGNVSGDLRLEIFDLFARKIEVQNSNSARFKLQGEQYQTGLYLYNIYKGSQLIANGKFIVQ